MLPRPLVRRLSPPALAALGLLALGSCTTAEEPAGSPPLVPEQPFDGRSLADWEGDPRFWRVEEGVLIGESTPDNPCERTTYLTWTGGQLGDFDLSLEVRLSAGNSGVHVRSARGPDLEVLGYQADLDAANEWTGGIYEQGGRGVVVRRGEGRRFAPDGSSSPLPLDAPLEGWPGLRPGAWTRLRVVGQGPRLTVQVDGVTTSVLVDRHPDLARRRGVLALQLHQGAPMRAEFRSLRLVHLEPESEAPAEPGSAVSAVPRWIWTGAEAAEGERAWLFRCLELERPPLAARLEGSCDNGMRVLLNGEAVLQGDDWSRPVRVDVGSSLREGCNTIAVAARNEGGPAALQLALIWTDADGVERRVVTDRAWHVASEAPEGWDADGFDPASLPSAVELAPLGGGTWGSLPEPAPPPRDSALPAEELELAPGYAAELLYSVPRALQGSWVALTFDREGRAIASHERGGLYRVTLPEAPGADVEVELLDDTLGGAQGLAAIDGDLYVVAQPSGPRPCGLYRLRDPDGDGRYAVPELLRELDGSGEHGPHAVLRDLDGDRLLLVAGNHVRLPTDLARSRVPRVWAEDQLLPRRDDPGGHAVGVLAPGGWVASLDRDGGDAELVACGLRNVYDVAFGPDGELFAYDADMEWDAGLPWYRPPRVLHLVDGADFGWRHGSGKWPADWPDTLPSVVDTDLSSPTGVLYGASLHALAERDRAALFLADWAYGRILAVDLAPRGASWGGKVRPFISGRPLPVTDLAAGPDGCLYFITGGRGAQSGLYRVRWAGDPAQLRGGAASSPEGRGAVERRTRRRLAALRAAPEPAAVAEAWPWLASDDPFLRHAARLVLETRPVDGWLERLQAETDPRAVAQAVVALAHTGDPAHARTATRALLARPLEQQGDAAIVDLMRALALVELRLGGLPEPQRGQLRARLEGIFPCGRPRVDRELLRLLVRLESERAVAPALSWLERTAGSEEATHVAFTLIEARAGWSDALRARFLDWVDAAPRRWSGGASFRGYLGGLADDAYARLGLDRARPVAGAASSTVEPRPFVRAWTLDDLAPELPRVESGRSFERGREAFVAAQCASCHQVRGQGDRTGPDLTGAGARFRPVEVLESILEPSRVISDQYQDTELLTLGDELLVGRLAGEDEQGLWLRLLPPDEVEVLVEHEEIARRRPHPLSRMPEGLLDVLELDETLDLLAFVLSGGEPDDARFR